MRRIIDCGIDVVAADGETPRRVVMVITDGMDNTSAIGPADVLRRANDLGVMVYALGMSAGFTGPIGPEGRHRHALTKHQGWRRNMRTASRTSACE